MANDARGVTHVIPERTMSTHWLLLTVRAILALSVFVAVGHQFRLHTAASYDPLNFFSYFTNLSNLIAALVLLLSILFRSRHRASIDRLRYVSAVNMAVVGIVFVTLLRNVDLGDLVPWVNVLLHYVMPVAVVLDWLIKPAATSLKLESLAIALVFPATYLVYVLLRGAAMGWYPYPFLNPANVGGYGGVALYSAGIFATFLAVGVVLLKLGRRAT